MYDAVHLYADGLVNCLENGGDPKNGTEIINAIKGRSYQSAMGYVEGKLLLFGTNHMVINRLASLSISMRTAMLVEIIPS